MAGFDFEVDAPSVDRPFLRSLFRLAQRLAHLRGLKLQYSWVPVGVYHSTVDGSLVSMQSFLEPLVIGLLSYAEGATEAGSAEHRKMMAKRLTGAYADGLDGVSEAVEGISEVFGGTPNSLSFDIENATHLKGHLDGFTNALSLYHQGRIKPHQIAEEAHTALELLMKEVLGSDAKGESFAGMAHLVGEKQYVEPHLVGPIIRLKNHRRGAKHKGQGVSYRVMDEVLPAALAASHRLTRIVRRAYESAHMGG